MEREGRGSSGRVVSSSLGVAGMGGSVMLRDHCDTLAPRGAREPAIEGSKHHPTSLY